MCQYPALRILAYLPPTQLAHLSAVAARHVVQCAGTWDDFNDSLRDTMCDIAVVDPGASGSIEPTRVLAALEAFPSTPMILYAPIVPATMQSVSSLARAGVADLVIYGYDDGPQRFLTLLERRAGDPLALAMLGRLSPGLSRLDATLSKAVATLFREPYQYRVSEDLASAAGFSRRTMYRQFEDAGFASPRIVVLGARLLRGYAYLRDPGHTLDAISQKLGFSSQRSFSERMREVVGELADRVRRRVDPQDFLERLTSRLLTPSL